MCGIAGWVGTVPEAEHCATRMIGHLRHRGPDARGIQLWDDAALVHTRLSIIDVSATGAQPLSNEDGTVWTVFNGEIYNHRELRRKLEAKGHIFKGHSDTEVLPHLYEQEGPDCVRHLRGMFALAIYDWRARMLLLARDRFGIKPLYYAPSARRLAFASEIKALRAVPDVDARPDEQAISDFAALFFIPAPATFYAGIRALQPGETLRAELDGSRIRWDTERFHHWSLAPDPTLTLGDAVDRTDELLTAAVRRQMQSDVPLGALLSGGIDSSLVSAAAQAAAHGALRTFNVGFAETAYDETWAATTTAQHIQSCHETLELRSREGTWDEVVGLLRHAGQPFADTSLFAVDAVSRLMREHVTVALSGDGGDEAFGGYDYFWRIARLVRLQEVPPAVWRQCSRLAPPLVRLGVVRDHVPQRLRDVAGIDDTTIVQDLCCWVSRQEHSALCHLTNVLPVRRLFESYWDWHLPQATSRLERLSALTTEINARLVLPNDFLFKVDIASMRHGLEVRVPMLDEDLFEFGLSLPHGLKVKGRRCKRVLRGLAERRLPLTVANKPKLGFGIPMDTWINTDVKKRIKDVLLGPSCRLPEFFRLAAYAPVVEAFCGDRACSEIGRGGLYQRITMLLSLQLALADGSP